MDNKPPVITISQAPSKNSASASPGKKFGERLGNLENVTQAVLWVGLISLVAVVVAVTAMVIDQFHFNNQSYRDQTQASNAAINSLSTEVQNLSNQVTQLEKSK